MRHRARRGFQEKEKVKFHNARGHAEISREAIAYTFSIDSGYVAGMLSMACEGMQTSTLCTNFNERKAQLAGWPHHQIQLSPVEVNSVGQQGLEHSNVLIIEDHHRTVL